MQSVVLIEFSASMIRDFLDSSGVFFGSVGITHPDPDIIMPQLVSRVQAR